MTSVNVKLYLYFTQLRMNPLLIFHNHLYQSSSLIEGRLLLIDKEIDKIIDEFKATSGLPGFQSPANTSAKGRGAIPEVSDVEIDHYTVATSPIPMPNVKGVEGNFYKILPHTVNIKGTERGDFGIHADKNAPGSAGCVVLTSDIGWNAFQRYMNTLSAIKILSVPLLVSYSK